MKRLICLSIVICLVVTIFMSCASSSTEPKQSSGNVPVEMVGAWEAIHFVMTNKADPLQQVDLIDLGLQYSVAIQANGHYATTMIIPGDTTLTDQGVMSLSGDQLTVNSDTDGPTTVTCILNGNQMTITDNDSEFDFDIDGIEEPAIAALLFQKVVAKM